MHMEFNVLFYLGILFFGGLLFGRLAKLVRLPNVTGYLFAGLILGPYVTHILPADTVDAISIVSEMALAFIAFTIGCTFKKSYFQRVGFMPIVIAICEALGAVLLVQLALILCGFNTAESIILGAIAAATAPAATIMVIKQYHARGPVTETLMSVVAIDDAVALIAFGFCVTIAKAITSTNSGNLLLSILEPVWEVLLALLLGAAFGFFMLLPLRFFKKQGNRMAIIIGTVFLSSSLATALDASALLSCMMTGAVFCNFSSEGDSIADLTDQFTPPIFMLFFVISGAQLNISILPKIGVVGILYVVFRVIGKILGTAVGAAIMRADKKIKKYLGPTLIPQAGVAIGLTLVAQSVVPQFAEEIRAVVLCGTLIYEIIGPAVTKAALTKAGEITV